MTNIERTRNLINKLDARVAEAQATARKAVTLDTAKDARWYTLFFILSDDDQRHLYDTDLVAQRIDDLIDFGD